MCACQAILQLDLVLILVIFFSELVKLRLGKEILYMSMAFFVHRLAICDELLISMLGMLKEKIRCLNACQKYALGQKLLSKRKA